MTASIISMAEERLLRRAPSYPLPLGLSDRDYILACLEEVEEAFAVSACPAVSVGVLPGRALMRLFLDLRRTLRPQNADQRAAHGRLTSGILLLDTARAMAEEQAEADRPRSGRA
ncbi:hypothetical protein [Azospirillum sp. sgz302134]